MKTQEEIEQLVEKLYPVSPNPKQMIEGFERVAFKKGYSQCQEDMADKKYTEEDVIKALHSVELKNNKDYSKIFEGMKEYFNVLNKQD